MGGRRGAADRRSTEIIARLTGKQPEGWLGPGLAQSRVTLDLLKEAGYRYVMDWPLDDQPVWMRTRSGPDPVGALPDRVNDLPALATRHHTGRQFAEMIIDQFDEMLDQSKKYPLVFSSRCIRSSSASRSACAPSAAPSSTSWRARTICGSPPPARSRAIARACRRAPCRGADPDSPRPHRPQPPRKPGSTIRQLGCPPVGPGFRRDCEQVGSIRTRSA